MKSKRKIILDVLRALAGLCVVLFHLSEPFTWDVAGGAKSEQVCGHGYLAVEFFLLLMGYMLGYAYDRRWTEGMTFWIYSKRRLVRLHPYVLSGLLIGVVVSCLPLLGLPVFARWVDAAGFKLSALHFLAAVFMFPAIGSSMLAPFNACSWTLYYEYVGNLLYGLFVRRFGVKTLVACSALAFLYSVSFVFQIDYNAVFGTQCGFFRELAKPGANALHYGWGTTAYQCVAGFARLLFPFFFGLLLFRLGWKIRLPSRVALPLAAAVFLAVLFTPHSYKLGAPEMPWLNGVFDLAAVSVVFPLVLLVGVGSETPDNGDGRLSRVAVYLAELSYPLYMSHYPIMYVHNWWVRNHSAAMSRPAVLALCAAEYVVSLLLAAFVMRCWNRVLGKANPKS